MNEVEWIKSLDRPLLDEPPRRIDVTVSVMRAVHSVQHEDEAVLSIAAVFAVIAGVAAIALALPVWVSTQDPLAGFADALNLVLQ
jgi:hypothetical protein